MNLLFQRFAVLALVFVFTAVGSAHAATLSFGRSLSFDIGDPPQNLEPLTITADAEAEITAEFGFEILIPATLHGIFDRDISAATLTGSAVDAGAVLSDSGILTFSTDLKTLKVAVERDFAADEVLTISGLKMRVFDQTNSWRFVELHLDDDGFFDALIGDGIKIIDDNPSTDKTAPYPVSDLTVTQTERDAFTLRWLNPPDIDTAVIKIRRTWTRAGVERFGEFEIGVNANTLNKTAEFVDDGLLDAGAEFGSEIVYELFARDGSNDSEATTATLTLVDPDVAVLPVVCTLDYTPVCGSDGTTYSNACNAEAAGITEFTDGECAASEEPAEVETIETDERAAAAGITLSELENAISGYSDIAVDHWSSGFLARLTRDAVLSGYPDGTVQPDRTINRAELAKIATNAFDLPAGAADFSDVPTDGWFAPFVGALQQAGAAWTDADDYFPAGAVSRGEAVWVLLRAAGIAADTAPTTKPFPDVSTIHPYAAAIAYAAENEIVNGYENGDFGPRDTLTRAQVAKIVVLIQQKLAE